VAGLVVAGLVVVGRAVTVVIGGLDNATRRGNGSSIRARTTAPTATAATSNTAAITAPRARHPAGFTGTRRRRLV
jgi:hypothetical protein